MKNTATILTHKRYFHHYTETLFFPFFVRIRKKKKKQARIILSYTHIHAHPQRKKEKFLPHETTQSKLTKQNKQLENIEANKK